MIEVPALSDIGFANFANKAWRPHQAEVVQKIAGSKSRVVLVQAPTGAGKSPIALSAAKLSEPKRNRAYRDNRKYPPQSAVLTVTKQLQQQYLRDFSDYAQEVKGRGNYPCLVEPTVTADDAPCTVPSKDAGRCEVQNTCPYFVQRDKALNAPASIHNYAYFLNSTNYSGFFSQQSLLVLDEGHLLDDALMSFISSKIVVSVCAKFDIEPPCQIENENVPAYEIWSAWARRQLPRLKDRLEDIEELRSLDVGLRRLYRAGSNLLTSLHRLATSKEPWICEPLISRGQQVGWEFKPVWIGSLADEYLYQHAERTAILSATILDPDIFCSIIGVPDAEYIELPSTFPVGRKPVYFDPAWYGKYGSDTSGLVKRIVEVIRENKGFKGLVHCVSYALVNAIVAAAPPDVKARIMTHTSADRNQVFEEYLARTDDPVLLSPSMKEGVDLPGDLCRFIIIAKLPYPSLGSPQIKARMNTSLGDRWYQWKTTCDLLQMTGRGMRSADDWCKVYILDGAFARLFQRMRYCLPKWWTDDLKGI